MSVRIGVNGARAQRLLLQGYRVVVGVVIVRRRSSVPRLNRIGEGGAYIVPKPRHEPLRSWWKSGG